MNNQSIYVTGVGVVSCLGTNYAEHTQGLYDMVTRIEQCNFQNSNHHVKSFVGKILDEVEVPTQFADYYKNFKFAFKAFTESLIDSAVDLKMYSKIGICLGTSLGGKVEGQKVLEKVLKQQYDITYEEFERSTIHHIVDEILDYYDICVEYYVISTACSASNNAVILGMQLLKTGECDLVFCGGSDELADISLAGFTSLGAINTDQSCQPYTSGGGISLGEGAGFIVLEKKETVENRKTYGKILGGSISSDAHHITAPEKNGRGAEKIIDKVLANAGLSANDIDYVNGHGTGTQANDDMEMSLLSRKFSSETHISSTKGHIGHTLGAAGIIELINCIAMIATNRVPGTINNKNQEQQITANNFLKNNVVEKKINYALNLSFAFGGNNSCVLVSSNEVVEQSLPERTVGNLYITGKNSSLTSKDQTISKPKNSDKYVPFEVEHSEIKGYKFNDFKIVPKINPQQYRRVDNFSKMVIKTVMGALKNANIDVTKIVGDRVGIVFTTPSGPVETTEELERQVHELGYHNVSAVKFPFTVMNAAAGVLSILLKIKGPISVISSSGTGFIDGFNYGKQLMKHEDIDTIILVSATQITELSLMRWEKLNFDPEVFVPADFCTAFIMKNDSKEEDASEYIDSLQVKYSNKNKTIKDIKTIFETSLETLLKRNNIRLNQLSACIYNKNKVSNTVEQKVISVFIEGIAEKTIAVIDASEVDFSSDGAGEELYIALDIKGLSLVIAYSNYGGFSFMLVKNN